MSPAQKISIIGGSGFIGTRLATDLRQAGYDITIADTHSSATYPDFFRTADVRDVDSLKAACADSDIIFNLAAAHRDDVRPESLYYDINVAGAGNVCQAAEALGIQTIVFTSSAAVYGLQAGEPHEDSPHTPVNTYGVTKSQAEDVYRVWQAKDPATRTLVIVRPTVVFGIGNRGNVHTLIEQMVRGHFMMIGDGENRKSMAYVENVSGFLLHCLKFGPGLHVYNYVDKPDLTMNELTGTIRTLTGLTGPAMKLPRSLGIVAGTSFDFLARITGRNFPISKIRIDKFCATTVFSAHRIAATGYKPRHSLPEALEATIKAEFPQQAPSRAA